MSLLLEGCILILDPVLEALRELIDLAENTQSALAERDLIGVRHKEQQQATECDSIEGHASGSGTCHHDTPHDSDVL